MAGKHIGSGRVLAAHPAQPAGRPPVGWAAVTGVGTIAGIGFTVSILIATLAFGGTQLQEAKLGVLSTTLGASLVTWLVFRATALLPARLQVRALLGTTQAIVDLGAPVTPAATTSAARTGRSSLSSSTATSNAPTAVRPSRCCGNSWPGTVTCATCGGTSR